MRRNLFFILIFLLLSLQAGAKDAKYVFYLIGDGMGLNLIAATETYKASIQGRVGTEPLNFHYFPVASYATTYNLSKSISDSGSSGTALATGCKTETSHIGVDAQGNPFTNLADVMLAAGRQVGIITSGNINDATPAVFYGHQPSRKNYTELVGELSRSEAAFIAGTGFYLAEGATEEQMLKTISKKKTVIRSLDEYKGVRKKADKIVFVPDRSRYFRAAINRKEGDGSTKLSECLRTTIDFLESKDKSSKGFFIMAESSEIDHCAHKNDAAAAIKEVLDFEEAVAVAIEFYNRHPEETAILVVSDHDTGGIGLIGKTPGQYASLQHQKVATEVFVAEFIKRYKSGSQISWDEYKQLAGEFIGLWSEIKVKSSDEKRIKSLFDKVIQSGDLNIVSDEFRYGKTPMFIRETFKVYNRYSGIVWSHDSHTAGFVPVFYKGPRADLFAGPLDNTSFFNILKAASGL